MTKLKLKLKLNLKQHRRNRMKHLLHQSFENLFDN